MSRELMPTSAAFSVERVRAAMLEGVAIPSDMFQKAIDTTYQKLTAKRTQFFSFQGNVTDKVDVEDHATQLAAADKIFAITGVYARERDQVQAQPTIAMEIDPQTGIVRLVIGAVLPPGGGASVAKVIDSVVEEKSTLPQAVSPVPEARDDLPLQIIKVRKGTLPASVHNALFGPEQDP